MNETAKTSEVDTLTGLPGYDAFMLAVSMRKPKGAQGSIGDSFSLGLVDLDGFGALNKEHGSETGDEALRSIAARLSEAAGDRAVAYRYGGDAFMLLFPNTEKEQAFLAMESVRKALEGKFQKSGSDSPTPAITVSIGVAAYPDDGSTEAQAIRKCHEALYRAKVSGRNKVCLAREEKMVTKTTHYTQGQLEGLSRLAKREGVNEAALLREALDDLLRKYNS